MLQVKSVPRYPVFNPGKLNLTLAESSPSPLAAKIQVASGVVVSSLFQLGRVSFVLGLGLADL